MELEDLLGRAENQQQQVDRQLADMDGYNQRALEAVQSGNNVLKDAQDTLRTLQGKCSTFISKKTSCTYKLYR